MGKFAQGEGLFEGVGLFVVFRIARYMPYIAIGLIIAMIFFWVVFSKKKLKWAKTLAIILTVLAVIAGLLSFTPYIMGAVTGKGFPGGEFPGGRFEERFPRDDGEQFRDFREREDSLDSSLYIPEQDTENRVVKI